MIADYISDAVYSPAASTIAHEVGTIAVQGLRYGLQGTVYGLGVSVLILGGAALVSVFKPKETLYLGIFALYGAACVTGGGAAAGAAYGIGKAILTKG